MCVCVCMCVYVYVFLLLLLLVVVVVLLLLLLSVVLLLLLQLLLMSLFFSSFDCSFRRERHSAATSKLPNVYTTTGGDRPHRANNYYARLFDALHAHSQIDTFHEDVYNMVSGGIFGSSPSLPRKRRILAGAKREQRGLRFTLYCISLGSLPPFVMPALEPNHFVPSIKDQHRTLSRSKGFLSANNCLPGVVVLELGTGNRFFSRFSSTLVFGQKRVGV